VIASHLLLIVAYALARGALILLGPSALVVLIWLRLTKS
jgi:hypothetical protein